LDVILENNLSTIRVLENVMSKLNQMSAEESNKYRLTDTLGGTSETIHIKAIQRVYGDKAKDFIDGLKRNPSVVVPLVLKRLKAKDEEWREAKKNSEKIWREQIERNYLKSLDHCAASFKQNDQKHLKAKSLTNEIEQIYNEREKAKEDSSADAFPIANVTSSNLNESSKRPLVVPTTNSTPVVERNPHLIIKYEEKNGIDEESILEDAAALIIHHVKRQQGIHKEDKNKMKKIMKHFIPDFFFVTRGCLSDDESESALNKQQKNQQQQQMIVNQTEESTSNQETTTLTTTDVDVTTKKLRSSTIKTYQDKTQNSDIKQQLNPVIQNSIIEKNDHSPEDMYRLFFVDDHWYLFFRYHHILCERLFKIYKNSLQITEQENIDSKNRDQSVAESLKLRNKPEIATGDYYKKFLDIVRSLLDLNMEPTQYEDTLREMFGINAYIAFTLDKVVQNCVRQLQFLVQDETSSSVRNLFTNEQKSNSLSFGPIYGRVSNMYSVNIANAEFSYQKKSEALLTGTNCFQITSYKNSNRLTIQLLDTQEEEDDEDSEIAEIEKWSEYIEKYCNDETTPVGNEIKELLLKKPVFLTRNAHCLKTKYEKHLSKTQQPMNTQSNKNQSELLAVSDSNNDATNKLNNEQDSNENNNDTNKETEQSSSLVIKDESVYRFNPLSYRLNFSKSGTSLMYRKNSFKNAKRVNFYNFIIFFKKLKYLSKFLFLKSVIKV
jgi:paired amphipathic helix protein Sin3a